MALGGTHSVRISPSRNPRSAYRSSTALERKAWATSSGIPSLLTGLASLKTGPASRRLGSVRPFHGVGRQGGAPEPGVQPTDPGQPPAAKDSGVGQEGTWGEHEDSEKPPLLPRISLWQPSTRASTLAGRASRAAIQKGKTGKKYLCVILETFLWFPFRIL